MQSRKKENSVVTSRQLSPTVLGFSVEGYPEITFDLTKVHPSNRAYAEIHGWGQRVPDKAAIPVADKDGNIIEKTERNRRKHAAIAAVVSHYESGAATWSTRAAKADDSLDRTAIVQAIVDVQGCSHESATAYVEGQAKSLNVSIAVVLATLASQPKFAERLAEMRGERIASAGIDAAAMLANLPKGE